MATGLLANVEAKDSEPLSQVPRKEAETKITINTIGEQYALESMGRDNDNTFILGDSRNTLAAREVSRQNRKVISREGRGNGYAFGNCTYYVASQKPVPNGYGDAKYWPVNSQTPEVGAIIVTYESWRGHVGIIRAVDGYMVTIEEMNYAGFNRVSTRTVDYHTLPLKGFLTL